jgi:two-component system cell cycle response regulator
MSTARILVVDDNPTNLKLASELLEFEGYHILRAVDAEEAQLIIQRTPPDLILMDIALPGMDGLTLTRKLKADEKTRHIIIVALTAFAMKGDDVKAHEAGCDGYVTKPIDTRKLPELVAGFLLRISGTIADNERKILVIEDHPPQLKLTNHVLSAAGNNVINAETAEEAFMAIRKDRPEVILLDLALPGMDGFTLVRKLKANAETRDIPVIAVTAFPEMFSKADALAAGCEAYLLKPLNTRTLPDEINAVVTGNGMTHGNSALNQP